jgi:hypothetical protein
MRTVVVSAVAGLFYHTGTVNPFLPDFGQKFMEGLRLYRDIANKDKLQKHEVGNIDTRFLHLRTSAHRTSADLQTPV